MYNSRDDTFETLAPYKTPPDTKIKNHIVVINSIDRNWYGYPQETPYNYLVKLGGSASDRYSTVSHDYKNVVSFSVDKIILPNRPCIQSYASNIAPRLNDYPYLTMNVIGINFSSYGTNKTLNNTIGIFTPLIPLPKSLSDISYLEYKNTSIQKKDYLPSPEGYISRVDLNIMTPSGSPASNLTDVLDIYSIFLNTSNAVPLSISDTLVIQTNTYFSNIEFKTADLMLGLESNVADSISCLHTIEHFGLGRYGDPLNPSGHIEGLKNMINMLETGGILYVSFPIGKTNEVHFNAHRVFHPKDIFSWVPDRLNLVRFDFVDDNGEIHKNFDLLNHELVVTHGCGIYTFCKI